MGKLTFADFIPAIASGVNSLASLAGMPGSAHYQRRNMREAARLQHEENVFWAEYNTPENQMARLKAAGLNPNLVYDNGANAQFQGSVSPNGAAPEFKGTPGSDYLSFARMSKEMEVMDAEREKKQKEANYYQSLSEGQDLKNRKDSSAIPEYQGWIERKRNWQEYLNSTTENHRIHSQYLLMDSQAALNRQAYNLNNQYSFDIQKQVLNKYYLENAILKIQSDNLDSQLKSITRLNQARVNEAMAHVANLKALSDLYDHQKELVDAEQVKATNEADRIKVQKQREILQGIGDMLDNGKKVLENFLLENEKYISDKTKVAKVITEWIKPVQEGAKTGKIIQSMMPSMLGGDDNLFIGY